MKCPYKEEQATPEFEDELDSEMKFSNALNSYTSPSLGTTKKMKEKSNRRKNRLFREFTLNTYPI